MLRVLLSLFTLPAFFCHELTHCLAAIPWANRVALCYDVRSGRPSAKLDWRRADAPKAIAALAPFVTGSVIGVGGVLGWLMTGAELPRGAAESAAWTVLLIWWLVYTVPSESDLSYVQRSSSTQQQTTSD